MGLQISLFLYRSIFGAGFLIGIFCKSKINFFTSFFLIHAYVIFLQDANFCALNK